MSKKGILGIVAAMLITVGVVIGITLAMNPEEAAPDTTKIEAGTESNSQGKAAAEALIGQSLTKEEVEAAVGKWNDFDMSSNGCERGVYAGRFYYDDFNIFSRTYDKGQTFSIVSVND